MFKKTLIAHFFTTIDFKIAFRSFLILLNPYFWFHLVDGKYIKICEEKLLSYLGLENSKIISFYNARSAIHNCLKIIGINPGDEILVQAYTCVSVPNSIIQAGGIPIYLDIDETLNIYLNSIEKSITKKTKALIVQHTFGNPANIEEIQKICKKHNLILIEDCAHSLGSEINNQKIGTFGDLSVFSTGRDKVISTVTGGFLVINNEKYFDNVGNVKLENIGNILALRNIFYNLTAYKAYKFYDFFGLGKAIIFLSRKLNLITKILTKEEKECNFKYLNYKLPNCLAYLGVFEIEKIDEYNKHRIEIANIYKNGLKNENIRFIKEKEDVKNNYFGFAIETAFAKELLNFCKKENILLGNYRNGNVIIPAGTNLEKAFYKMGTYKNAENICKNILTLPNHNLITKNDALKIVEILNNFKI